MGTIIFRIKFGVVVLVSSLAFFASDGHGQEVSFTPRYDSITPAKKRVKREATPLIEAKKAPQLYSLARYNLLFQEMCRLLEADGRRERVYKVCKAAVEEEQGCSSCRALLRQIAQSCSPKALPKKTPVPIPSLTPVPPSVELPVGDNQEANPIVPAVQSAGPAPVMPPAAAQPKRYPRTDLIDVVSRLSDEMHEFSPGPGPVFDAVRSFETHLVGREDLTPGERDYYGHLLSYLFSAWDGRPDSPLNAGTPSPSEIAELFE